ncbi:hypothetical protein BURK1_02351 [Burkholderiales bacterium]|nr:hypothetical protein BURK1_02351 [Burkholderiales bacterium]
MVEVPAGTRAAVRADPSAMTAAPPLPPTGADGAPPRQIVDGRGLLRQAFALYAADLGELARTSIETTNDLFELSDYVSRTEAQEFQDKRAEWLKKFDSVLLELFERRLAGDRRRGRRPDFDASLASLRVLTAFDHDKQAALTAATGFLVRFTRRELEAMDLRVAELLGERPTRDLDSPFSPAYLLDALGVTSRAIYPVAKIWRPLMERLVADITPSANKVYIRLNRFLADRNVLPDIKAALRARSDLWPEDDRDLLPAFSRLMSEAGPLPTDIVIPPTFSDPSAPLALRFAEKLPSQRMADATRGGAALPEGAVPIPADAAARLAAAPQVIAGLAALSKIAAGMPAAADALQGDMPNIDPLMALGTNSPLFKVLAQWQRIDLPAAIAEAAPKSEDGAVVKVPQNLVPYIRLAIADQLEHETDRITMDVIALLFDYVFGDPSIPESLRELFGRLQVPVVKVGLLDRTFFSDRAHPARKFLDHLAGGAIGATGDPRYFDAFRSIATTVIDDVCYSFEIDVAAFAQADRKLVAFIESEQRSTETAAGPDVATALANEQKEEDRSAVRASVRDKLAGIDVPFEVRSFTETVWADHLANLRKREGPEGAGLARGLKSVDDLLWSITAKERTAQKARLAKMVPALVTGLRAGCRELGVEPERTQPFFDALYRLHIEAIKPAAAKAEADAAPPAAAPSHGLPATANVHDFVNDMVIGTWLAFASDDGRVNARLHWISPMRTRYVFTSRLRSRAFVYSPEELAWEITNGRAALVMEPVPLVDRAVSAALDRIGAQRAGKAA